MMNITTTTGLIGVGMAMIILLLLRRDHIFILQALFLLSDFFMKIFTMRKLQF